MPQYIYALTETNVDGCGHDATEYVAFSVVLDAELVKILKLCLRDAATTTEDLDTSQRVETAIAVFKTVTNVEGRIVSMPVLGEIKF